MKNLPRALFCLDPVLPEKKKPPDIKKLKSILKVKKDPHQGIQELEQIQKIEKAESKPVDHKGQSLFFEAVDKNAEENGKEGACPAVTQDHHFNIIPVLVSDFKNFIPIEKEKSPQESFCNEILWDMCTDAEARASYAKKRWKESEPESTEVEKKSIRSGKDPPRGESSRRSDSRLNGVKWADKENLDPGEGGGLQIPPPTQVVPDDDFKTGQSLRKSPDSGPRSPRGDSPKESESHFKQVKRKEKQNLHPGEGLQQAERDDVSNEPHRALSFTGKDRVAESRRGGREDDNVSDPGQQARRGGSISEQKARRGGVDAVWPDRAATKANHSRTSASAEFLASLCPQKGPRRGALSEQIPEEEAVKILGVSLEVPVQHQPELICEGDPGHHPKMVRRSITRRDWKSFSGTRTRRPTASLSGPNWFRSRHPSLSSSGALECIMMSMGLTGQDSIKGRTEGGFRSRETDGPRIQESILVDPFQPTPSISHWFCFHCLSVQIN